MTTSKKAGISFKLSEEQSAALKLIGGERTVRLAGKVNDGQFQIDFIACNSPFSACNSAFASCNSSFSACNSSFVSKKPKKSSTKK